MSPFEAGSLLGAIVFAPLWAALLFVAIYSAAEWLIRLFVDARPAGSAAIYVAVVINLIFGLLAFMGGIASAETDAARYLTWIDLFGFVLSIPIGIAVADKLYLRRRKREDARALDTNMTVVSRPDLSDTQ